MRKTLPSILFFLISFIANGQQPYFKNLSSFDGLASNKVYSCIEDSEGYIWFGTEMGVSRYNGYEFENFDAKDGLTGNEIFEIHEDTQKRIWFLSFNGEFSYYKKDEFHNFYNDSTLKKLKSLTRLSFFYEDSNQTIYISSNQFLHILDRENNVKKINLRERIFGIWEGSKNKLNILTNRGYYSFETNEKLKKITKFDFVFMRSIKTDDAIFVSNRNNLYNITDTLNLLASAKNQAEITWIGKSKRDKNILYIGTRMGLYIYSISEKTFLPDHYLQESIITHTCEDSQGNLWITTEGEGVFLSTTPSIKVYTDKINLPLNQVTCLKKGINNELWIGMRNGYYSRLKNGNITSSRLLYHESKAIRDFYTPTADKLIIVSRSIMAVIENNTPKYFNFSVKDVITDSNLVYIVGSKFSIFTHKDFYGNLSIEPFKQNIFFKTKIMEFEPIVSARNIEKNENGEIYLGTQQTLYKLYKSNLTDLGKKINLLQATINDLVYDTSKKLLYVATNSKGIIVLERDTLKYVIDSKNGLSSDNCLKLFLDDNGTLIVITSNGLDLIQLDDNQLQISDYGNYLNLKSKRVNDIEKIGQILYLATNEGLLEIDLNQINQDRYQPLIYIRSIFVNGEEKIAKNQPLKLTHTENSIEFNFLGLSYKSLGNITYQYKLEGYHKNWQKTKNRKVVFEALSPGEYVFKLKIKDQNKQNSNVNSFSFSIAIPYWKTTSFIVIITLLLALLIGIILYYRVQRVRKQYELEKKIVLSEIEKLEIEKAYLLAEQKAGVLQMNPHFLFNSLNTIKGFYSQNKLSEANWFISKFSKLLRRILECNTQFITLDKEIEILQIYMKLMQKRHDDHFSFTLQCNIEKREETMIPPMILQPIIENAVLHGIAPIENGKVQIIFSTEKEFFKCCIIDNGVGFHNAPAQIHKSVGLSNIKDRLDLLSQQYKINCKIDIKSPYNLEKSTGTKVTVYFPLKFTTNESNNH